MSAGFGAGWRQVGACALLGAVGSVIASAYGVIAVPLMAEFHPSRMVLMLSITIATAGSALLSPLLGSLLDRMSIRLLCSFGVAAVFAGYVGMSFATSFEHVLIIFGLCMAPANILVGPFVAGVLLPRWFVRRRGLALSVAVAGVAAGSVVFPPIIQALLDGYDWRVAFRLLALLLVLVTLPAVAMIVDRPEDRGLNPDGAKTAPVAAPGAPDQVQAPLGWILGDPSFWMLAAASAIVLSGMIGMVTNLVPMAIDQGVAPQSAALLISIYAGIGVVAKLGSAAIVDRLNLRVVMFVVLGFFAAGMACLIRADLGYGLIAFGVGLAGVGGVMIILQGMLVPRIFGPNVIGRVSGLLNALVLCSLLATPPIFGLIFDRTGSYASIFMIFTGLAIAALAMVPFIRLHPRPLPADDGTLLPVGATLAQEG